MAWMFNLRRKRQTWARMTRLLGIEGAYARSPGRFYVTFVHVVLLYGLEMWVITQRIESTLGGLQHRVACRMIGRKPQRVIDGMWRYPLLLEAMEEAELKEMDIYVSHF